MTKKCRAGEGRFAEEFDQSELLRGIKVEMEHTCDARIAERIAIDHLSEDPHYYTMLAKFHKNGSFRPNRRTTYDVKELAQNYVRTFKDREVEFEVKLPFSWPRYVQNVGDSLAVAYASDKWQKGEKGKRKIEEYKHIAESRNKLFAVTDFFVDEESLDPWDVIGPVIDISEQGDEWPMPQHFTVLAPFIEANFNLYTSENDRNPKFSRGEDGYVRVKVAHAMLGFSKIMWSTIDPEIEDQPFLFVYDDNGVKFIIVGEKLEVEKDGIVG